MRPIIEAEIDNVDALENVKLKLDEFDDNVGERLTSPWRRRWRVAVLEFLALIKPNLKRFSLLAKVPQLRVRRSKLAKFRRCSQQYDELPRLAKNMLA